MKCRLRKWPLLFFLFISCITQPGIQPVTDAGRGNIIVREKNGLPAQVYLDYRMTGYKTPVTIQDVPSGTHTLHIFYENYRPIPELINVNVAEKTNNEAEFELQKYESGAVEVLTTPSGAMVTLNSVDYGRSPLTITGLPAGDYTISALLGNRRAKDTSASVSSVKNPHVLLNLTLAGSVTIEYFGNTNCPGCPAADAAIENLMDQLPQYKDMVFKISYHAGFPSQNDPFFIAAKDDQLDRAKWYGVDTDPGGLPVMYLNGKKIKFSDEQVFIADAKKQIEDFLGKPATADLVFGTTWRDSLRAWGTVTVHDSNPDKVLFVSLIEDFIGYQSPPGTNNQRLFRSVFRGFSPDANGVAVTETSKTVSFSFDISRYAQSDLSFVAFLQDRATNEIVQSQRVYIQE